MKKLFGTKGQGAMEYLMTYGWAILVVMVVGIAMWQLGIFNMGGTTVTATGFAKIKPQLAGTGLQNQGAGGTFTGVFTNGVGTRIMVKTFTVWDLARSPAVNICDHTTGAGANDRIAGVIPAAWDPVNGHPVDAGENFEVIITPCSIPASVAGEVYNIRVEMDYDVDIGGVTSAHRESGTFRGPLE